jgi:outer membrane protein OmpA-like peptidoglycan-associated protein
LAWSYDRLSGGLFANLIETAQALRRRSSNMHGRSSFTAILSLSMIGAALSFSAATATAADVTEDQIVRALTAKKDLTRGLSIGPQADPAAIAAEASFIEKIRGLERVLSASEREEVAAIAKDKPKIDLEITFDYNSADITAKSMPSVQALGRALTNPDLRGSTFVVAGHTDAAGLEAYNQDLSQRRADSIKRYLIDKFSIAGTDLVTVGYGKTKLKDPSKPFAEVNRRVQVLNIANNTNASK